MIDLTILLVTWNTRELTLSCLDSIERELGTPECPIGVLRVETVVVDNASQDGTAEALRARHPWVQVLELPENRGFAGGNNAALTKARGRIVLLLNSDVVVERRAVERCVAVLDAEPDVAVVGPQLQHADGRLQNSVHRYPGLVTELLPLALLEVALPHRFPSKRYRHSEPLDVEAVLGAALFVRKRAVDEVGGPSDAYFFFMEETDWCWRLRSAGWRVLHVPDARFVHLSGASSKKKYPVETRIEYERSLYRFLGSRRGAGTLAIVMGVRILRDVIALVAFAPVAAIHPRERARWIRRWKVLRWHLNGRPNDAGLAGLGTEPTEAALDAGPRTRKAGGMRSGPE